MKVNGKLETDTYRHRSLWLKQALVGESELVMDAQARAGEVSPEKVKEFASW